MNETVGFLAQSDWVSLLRQPETLVFMVPIVAILVGGIMGICKQLIRHRERMAMIERGMHPDHPHSGNPQNQELGP
jgi:hypothetical protein